MLQPLPVMARLAAAAPGMDMVTTAVLPLAHPVDVAEQVATLDVITSGHAVLATALGYRDEETSAFGIARRDRVSRMVEALEVMKLLWHGEGPVTYEGRHFQLHDAPTGLRPIQRPGPPVWIAASSDAASSAPPASATLGSSTTPITPPSSARSPSTATPARRPATRVTSTCPSSASSSSLRRPRTAVRIAQPYVSGKYETYAQWGQDQALEGERSFTSEFAALAKDRFIVGNVEQVVADLKRYEALGITHIGLRMRWAGMPPEPTADAMRLTAERVFPYFR